MMPKKQDRQPSLLTRRAMLQQAACGFGAVAMSALGTQNAFSSLSDASQTGIKPHGVHFPARAKRVIFLYMDGGPSQVDTFDPKPMLDKYNGQDPSKLFNVEQTQFNNDGNVLASPWKFNQYGESGIPISDLFPHVAKHADKLAVIRSATSPFSEHTFANYFLHTGSGLQGRPSMGAWINYGLGSENENLPGFVVLNGGLIPPGGLDCFNSGFLPASLQGSVFKPSGTAVANINPLELSPKRQLDKLDLMKQLDQQVGTLQGADQRIESAIRNHELAFKMQTEVPGLMDLGEETAETKRMYGLEAEYKQTQIFGTECLVARRLMERGVRFVELTCPSVSGDRWDQHGNLKKGHENNARAVDQPIGALLTDLEQRGLLDDTLVVWMGEFGRTPFAQGKDGRDHNPFGFSLWMAGGGIKPGTIYGATDEWGYKAIDGKIELHDLHATMLHLLGVEHTKSTFRFSGRDMRLTDVHGHVIHDVIA